ncbi:MAG: von Willebrand factor type A domain-containing protein [Planctomycetes bacterium]|nr:von Willebrand factor type A domain-containing protein [Planctomycetota bacterium]
MTNETRPDTNRDPADDPRLTAYALGELDGDSNAAARAEVEAILARDPAARAFVDETRALGGLLRDEFAAAPAATLTDAQRTTVMSHAAGPSRGTVLRLSNWSIPAGVAAALLVGVTFSYRHEIGNWWDGSRDVAAGPDRMRYIRTEDESEVGSRREAGADAALPARPGRRAAAESAPAEVHVTLESERIGAAAPKQPEPAGEPAGPQPRAAPVALVPPAPTQPPAGHLYKAALPGSEAKDEVGFRMPPGGGGGGGGARLPVILADSPEIGDRLRRLEALGYVGGDKDGNVVGRYAATGSGGIVDRRLVALGSESYARFADNPFRRAIDAPLSTFGIDVDTASYANVRRFLTSGRLPPPDAVRIEEMVNYFTYRYTPPTDGTAFAANVEVAGCPWDTSHRLVRVALKGRVEDIRERPAANLVFLVDVSGSMQPENKLPLLIQSMKQLVPALTAQDRVSIVTYAGAAGVALQPTRGDQHETILAALGQLAAGGSTNGAAGISTAYELAQQGFIHGGVNRVILATDGDFNVGVSDNETLVQMIQEKAKSKVFLSVLGFGEGNLQDAKMESIANKGNGNYAYVDSLREGRRVLVDQAAGTLIAIAKDVKLQIEFNPLRVAEYRLIGYENRTLAARDFSDDTKDAGDLGAGHTVTALYEVLTTTDATAAGEQLRYQRNTETTSAAHSNELLVVKLRWKLPEGDKSTYREIPVTDSGATYARASADFKFAAAVAGFGMILRGSPNRGNATLDSVMELATDALDFDPDGRRAEFVDLVRATKMLSK